MVNLGGFPRIDSLPPYVLALVTKRTYEMRSRERSDVINLGMGTPDGPTPQLMLDKLKEAAQVTRNNRYTSTVGVQGLRVEIVKRYERDYGVGLNPDTEALVTVGVKDAAVHLPVALLGPGDGFVTHSPSYPIHIQGAMFADADVTALKMTGTDMFLDQVEQHIRSSRRKPRMILFSFPHNPTTLAAELSFFEEMVGIAHRYRIMLVHDFAYSRLTYDDYKAPSLLQVPGAREVAVELISLSKEYNVSGWRCGFAVGNQKMIGGLRTLKSYIDYGVPLPIQIACIVGMRHCESDVERNCQIYKRRRDVLVNGLEKLGWPVTSPKGTIFVWARIPEQYKKIMDSSNFSQFLLEKAQVACSPGVGFGEFGEGWVRFALVENEGRIRQALKFMERAFQGKSPSRRSSRSSG